MPLHIARPVGDRAYFRSARAALRRLHAAGFTHNDLAKEQNWLRGADGRAYLTDFQLSSRFRGRTFRVAAYEDLRHYLKHKRCYAPEALTATEKRILARKSWITRIWMATGKKVYIAVTRGLFRFTDREGGGPRLVNDAPVIAAQLKSQAAGARRRGAGVSRPPRRHRALCLRRRRARRQRRRHSRFHRAKPAAPAHPSGCNWSTRCRAAPMAPCAPKSCSSSR